MPTRSHLAVRIVSILVLCGLVSSFLLASIPAAVQAAASERAASAANVTAAPVPTAPVTSSPPPQPAVPPVSEAAHATIPPDDARPSVIPRAGWSTWSTTRRRPASSIRSWTPATAAAN